MEFSDMMKRCKLLEISNYLIGYGESAVESKDLDFATAIRNMEKQTNKFLEEHFEYQEERDAVSNEMASRETVTREIYFQMGFIAGINLSREIERKTKELNRKKHHNLGFSRTKIKKLVGSPYQRNQVYHLILSSLNSNLFFIFRAKHTFI